MVDGPLHDIKVVELATMVSGPYCGKLLADMGADVVKIEPPEGDPSRRCGPFPAGGSHSESSALFLYTNTSKRGVTLNLDEADGLDVFKRFIRWADVLIDNHPPPYIEGLGLSWDAMTNLNPALVYTSITPYGRTGPRSTVKGDELTLIQAAGLGNLIPYPSPDASRPPLKTGGYPVGYHGGLTAALATIAALIGRMDTGRGQAIDISLQEAVMAMVQPNMAGSRYYGTLWSRMPARPPASGRMRTSDGYVIVGAFEDHHFRALMDLMGNPDWAAGPEWDSQSYRTNHAMDMAPWLHEWMLQQTSDDLYHRAAQKGIPMGPINSAKDVANNGQYLARQYFVDVEHPHAGIHRYAGWPYRMSATQPEVHRPAPLLGQHNREVYCTCLEYSEEELERLTHMSVI